MRSHNIEAVIDRRLAEIETLVANEDFSGVERAIRSLPDLTAGLPDEAREAGLLRIQEFLAGIHARTEAKSEHIRAKLKSLRGGREANKAYEAAARVGLT